MTPTLPGLEGAIQKMEEEALDDMQLDKLPTYTAERVANFEPKRYELAARLLFAENISRRTICKWLHMSPNTLSAIEVREIRLNPERIASLKAEANAELEQLKRIGREALRARFFDEKALEKIGIKELASTLKILDEMSVETEENKNGNRNIESEPNEYIETIGSWKDDGSGFGREKISAPENSDCLEDAALRERPAGEEKAEEQHEKPQKGVADGSERSVEGPGATAVQLNSTELHLK